MKIEYNNLYTHFIFTTLHSLLKLISSINNKREPDNPIRVSSFLLFLSLFLAPGSWLLILGSYLLVLASCLLPLASTNQLNWFINRATSSLISLANSSTFMVPLSPSP